MPEIELGTLVSVDPKDIWENEAQDFTPWLLENPDVLSKAIGLDLSLDTNEYPVGTFSLDLIGVATGTKDIVIVENQLTPSDHTHLGQLLTYAGGTGAKYVVWVAPKFRDEHIAAIKRLNDTSTDESNFFAVEVSAVRIGNSARAPLFKLISGPNGWTRQVKASTASAGTSELNTLQASFWTNFLEAVKAKQPGWTNATKAPQQNWLNLPAGNSGFWYCVAVTKHELRSEFILGTSDAALNAARFNFLQEHKTQIEEALGGEVVWHLPDGNTQAIVRLIGSGSILNENLWDDAIRWLIDSQLRLRAAFGPLLKGLQKITSDS